MAKNDDLILRGKALKDLRGIKDVLQAQGDPFLASVMNRAIECNENQPAVEAIPIAVIKRAISGVNAADQCDQAGRYDYELRAALNTVLEWYKSPVYLEHEKRASHGKE